MLSVITNGEWTLLGAIIGVAGLFAYGTMAWVFDRLIKQLDDLAKTMQSVHESAVKLEVRVTLLEKDRERRR